MNAAIFIGDELTATGFRLTGLETVTPEPARVASVFADVRQRAALILITAEYASRVPAETLDAAIIADRPTVVVIPDVLARAEPRSLAKRMKSILGIES